LRVGYFEGWPLPVLGASVAPVFEEHLGGPVEWVPMSSGGEMAIALDAGEIDVGHSMDPMPFLRWVTDGVDLVAVGVAVDYTALEDCLVSPRLLSLADPVFDSSNAARLLNGSSVYLPTGGTGLYRVAAVLERLGVDMGSLTFVESEGSAAALHAFNEGSVTVSCAFGRRLDEMRGNGGVSLASAEDRRAWGVPSFDLVVTHRRFGDSHPEVLRAYLQAVEQVTAEYVVDPAGRVDEIAGASGLDVDEAGYLLDGMAFPGRDAQLASGWLGETIPTLLEGASSLGFATSASGQAVVAGVVVVDSLGGVDPMVSGVTAALRVATVGHRPIPLDGSRGVPAGPSGLWRTFRDDHAIVEGFRSGLIDVVLNQSLGSVVDAVVAGVDLTIVGVAADRTDRWNCALHPSHLTYAESVVTPDSALDHEDVGAVLSGRSIWVDWGGTEHLRVVRMLEWRGIDPTLSPIVDSRGRVDGQSAFDGFEAAVVCASGDQLDGMWRNGGASLVPSGSQDGLGGRLIEVVAVRTELLADGAGGREAVEALVTAMGVAARDYQADPMVLVGAMAEQHGADASVLGSALTGAAFPVDVGGPSAMADLEAELAGLLAFRSGFGIPTGQPGLLVHGG